MQVLDQQLYWKRKFSTGAFLWTLRNFSEHLFYRTPLVTAFVSSDIIMKTCTFVESFHAILSCLSNINLIFLPVKLIVKAGLLLSHFLKANSLLKIGRLRHINFSSRFINGCGGKKILKLLVPIFDYLTTLSFSKSSPPKFFSKVAVLNVLKNSLENEGLH